MDLSRHYRGLRPQYDEVRIVAKGEGLDGNTLGTSKGANVPAYMAKERQYSRATPRHDGPFTPGFDACSIREPDEEPTPDRWVPITEQEAKQIKDGWDEYSTLGQTRVFLGAGI